MKYFNLVIFLTLVASCAHQPEQARSTASANCYDSIKVEYHSYFDSYEKCMEKEPKK